MENWSKFYTPRTIAKEIVAKIPKDFQPTNVIDICAGSGNLLNAAWSKWADVNFIGVDVTSKLDKIDSNWSFHNFDATDIERLNNEINFIQGPRLVLANPPFGNNYNKKKKTSNNHELFNLFKVNRLNRVEADMLISNISLLREGDIFGALLPENIFTSEKFTQFRENLFQLFTVKYIGNSGKFFKGSEVKTRQFVGVFKGLSTKSNEKKNNLSTNSKINILRGIDNSKLIKDIDINKRKKHLEVIHFNNSKGKILNRKFIYLDKNKTYRRIEENDILIIRVGRNTGEIILPNSDHIGKTFSDHLIVVKNVRCSKLCLKSMEVNLKESIKGLTTKYISKSDVLKALDLSF